MQSCNDKAIRTVLMRRVWLRRVGAWLGILIGIPLLFIAPLLLGTLLWLAYGNRFGWRPWTWLFMGTAGVAIPLLIRLEIRTRGNYLSEVALDMSPETARIGHAMLTAWPMMGMTGVAALRMGAEPRAASAGFVEIFLIGPRLPLPGVSTSSLRERVAEHEDPPRGGRRESPVTIGNRRSHQEIAGIGGAARRPRTYAALAGAIGLGRRRREGGLGVSLLPVS